ncbi:MAG: histidine phosphatase family protein [Halofilum sp. (in: g-proteobacteria)]|nr:histidine phosphatase family protein [Halofilum sp. (in: g-proteobacteria)]
MKTLTLVRHAKSSWDDPDLADFDRPLNRRGERDAPEMARRLAAAGDPPDRIVTSPALRALQTARVLAPALGIDPGSLVTEPRIYEASYSRLVEVLRGQPRAADHVLLVGHAPGIADLARLLCGTPAAKFPTCGVVRMRLPIGGWQEAARGGGELVFFDYPKRDAR